MKSSKDQLRKRGFSEAEDLLPYSDSDISDLLIMLSGKEPVERTIAAKILANRTDPNIIPALTVALDKESKLYSKIAIADSLTAHGSESIPHLLPLLGTIGRNQYTKIPQKLFQKTNYPLPRDIVARILIRIGECVLVPLEEVCRTGKLTAISEAIDAIGFIAFYSQNYSSLPSLWGLLQQYPDHPLIFWKVIRAFESYPDPEVIAFLKKCIVENELPEIRAEARRSLNQIKKGENL